jgi:hypothetical protein
VHVHVSSVQYNNLVRLDLRKGFLDASLHASFKVQSVAIIFLRVKPECTLGQRDERGTTVLRRVGIGLVFLVKVVEDLHWCTREGLLSRTQNARAPCSRAFTTASRCKPSKHDCEQSRYRYNAWPDGLQLLPPELGVLGADVACIGSSRSLAACVAAMRSQ